jgi:hypothetical protein
MCSSSKLVGASSGRQVWLLIELAGEHRFPFGVSQFFPSNITILIGSGSQIVYAAYFKMGSAGEKNLSETCPLTQFKYCPKGAKLEKIPTSFEELGKD